MVKISSLLANPAALTPNIIKLSSISFLLLFTVHCNCGPLGPARRVEISTAFNTFIRLTSQTITTGNLFSVHFVLLYNTSPLLWLMLLIVLLLHWPLLLLQLVAAVDIYTDIIWKSTGRFVTMI